MVSMAHTVAAWLYKNEEEDEEGVASLYIRAL
jgi:hypothetical protein